MIEPGSFDGMESKDGEGWYNASTYIYEQMGWRALTPRNALTP